MAAHSLPIPFRIPDHGRVATQGHEEEAIEAFLEYPRDVWQAFMDAHSLDAARVFRINFGHERMEIHAFHRADRTRAGFSILTPGIHRLDQCPDRLHPAEEAEHPDALCYNIFQHPYAIPVTNRPNPPKTKSTTLN